ncbi:hypothetical protein HSBAA_54600 [Vreelandella sulfidaeris]|uniref:Uncharacterized protein n=1 Tax=Vreelandella sulfidaeris TaxID=115553 RepID=A0A455UMI8_9GAMM|nr:hypothetical protein HSBAA_54600 [Halomonas sulfidaeris]
MERPTLEWSTESPPPAYNYRHIPVVESRWPLWDWQERGERSVVSGLSSRRREVVITSILDAEPIGVQVLPHPTIWPFIAAVAASSGFIGIIFHPIFCDGILSCFLRHGRLVLAQAPLEGGLMRVLEGVDVTDMPAYTQISERLCGGASWV